MLDASEDAKVRDASIARSERRGAAARAAVQAATSLDALCDVLNTAVGAALPLPELFGLPKFGPAPAQTNGLWSWDAQREIVIEMDAEGGGQFVIRARQ